MQAQTEDSNWPAVDTLVATLLYLTSRFSFSQDLSLAKAIDLHFSMLEGHPGASPMIAKTGRQLRELWISQLGELEFPSDVRTSVLLDNANRQNIH